MRTLTDHRGTAWDVTIGKSSYGSLALLFCSRETGLCQRYVLEDETLYEAEGTLAGMADKALHEALDAADSWNPAEDDGTI